MSVFRSLYIISISMRCDFYGIFFLIVAITQYGNFFPSLALVLSLSLFFFQQQQQQNHLNMNAQHTKHYEFVYR